VKEKVRASRKVWGLKRRQRAKKGSWRFKREGRHIEEVIRG
jgi:hypothetical protein